jgi:hypothetical protein
METLSRRLAHAKDDAGYALAMVLGIGIVLMLLVVTATTYSITGFQATRSDQDWNAALAAAYAGADEYQSRLAGDSSYGQYGNTAASFTRATNSIVRAPAAANPAFAVASGGTWGSVVGSDGKASFRYEVDNSNFASYGQLRLRVTGRVGVETRSIVANLKGKGFIDFLYFTDFEISDPALNLNPATGLPTCPVPAKHAWEVTGFRTGCTEITFDNDDLLEGPVHSNDVIHICNATFKGKVTSAYLTSPYYSATYGRSSGGEAVRSCIGQDFQGGVPQADDSLTMPLTNNSLRNETAVNLPNTVPRPGCLYTGPTSIEFFANGTMRVISPWTKYTQSGAKDATPSPGVTKSVCGTPGPTGLGAAAGQIITVPPDNLIFVQEPPADTADPNYWAANVNPATSPQNATGYRGCVGSNSNTDSTKGQLAVAGNGIGYPTSGNVTVGTRTKIVNEAPPLSNSYGCRAGDVFVKGVVHGRVTVASSNYLYVTGNITYTDSTNPGDDMLGLIGGKAVWVWDPEYSDYSQNLTSYTNNAFVFGDGDRTIQGAILSVENTFTVQNYNTAGAGGGRRGTLHVTGAIAQRYRGVVSQAGGYRKDYKYDRRYITAAPPKFLAPVSTSYGVSSYADVKVAYLPNGTPQ